MRFNKLSYSRFVYKELMFVRSPGDFKILTDKFPIWSRMLLEQRSKNATPIILQLEPTSQCNLRCIMCPQDTTTREKGYMAFPLFKKIVDDAIGFGIKRIWLYAQGEPLLHPQIVEMVRYIKNKQLAVDITTNGMLLDAEKTRALFDAGMNSADYITFSVMGSSKEVHEAVMKRANHELIERNILGLMELKRHRKISGPIVQIKFYSMPENQHEESSFIKKWENKVDRVLPITPISLSFYKDTTINNIPAKRTFCTQAWDRITVYWNGDMTVCNNDTDGKYILGNLSTESISAVWHSEKYEEFRNFHRKMNFENLPLCTNCDI